MKRGNNEREWCVYFDLLIFFFFFFFLVSSSSCSARSINRPIVSRFRVTICSLARPDRPTGWRASQLAGWLFIRVSVLLKLGLKNLTVHFSLSICPARLGSFVYFSSLFLINPPLVSLFQANFELVYCSCCCARVLLSSGGRTSVRTGPVRIGIGSHLLTCLVRSGLSGVGIKGWLVDDSRQGPTLNIRHPEPTGFQESL